MNPLLWQLILCTVLAGSYDDGGKLGLDEAKCSNSTAVAKALADKIPGLSKCLTKNELYFSRPEGICTEPCRGTVVDACQRVVSECPGLSKKKDSDPMRKVAVYQLWSDKKNVDVMCKSLGNGTTTCLQDLFQAASNVQNAKAKDGKSASYGNHDLTDDQIKRICSPCTEEIFNAFQGKEDQTPGLYLLDLIEPKQDLARIGDICGYDLARPPSDNTSQGGTNTSQDEPAPKNETYPVQQKPAPKNETYPVQQKPAPKNETYPVQQKPAPENERNPAQEKPAPQNESSSQGEIQPKQKQKQVTTNETEESSEEDESKESKQEKTEEISEERSKGSGNSQNESNPSYPASPNTNTNQPAYPTSPDTNQRPTYPSEHDQPAYPASPDTNQSPAYPREPSPPAYPNVPGGYPTGYPAGPSYYPGYPQHYPQRSHNPGRGYARYPYHNYYPQSPQGYYFF